MAGILVSIAVSCFIVLQASLAGASDRITVPAGAAIAAVMAAFWALAIQTLYPGPDLWDRVAAQMAMNFVFAGLGGAAFTWSASRLIAKIAAFRDKYPDR